MFPIPRMVCSFDIYTCTNNSRRFPVELGTASIDLSRATRLKGVAFRHMSQETNWVTKTLQTITAEHQGLQQITVNVPSFLTFFNVGSNVRQIIGEAITRQWLDLDHLLIQLWESRSIRPRVEFTMGKEKPNLEYCIGCLLPEVTGRGIIDLVSVVY